VGARFEPIEPDESARVNRSWWDADADDYQAEHGDFLGGEAFIWGPEGLDEADARLLGDVRGLDVLEVGAGAAQCSAWLAAQGARVVASDLSDGMLAHARGVPAVQCDARRLPFAAASFDAACSAYGAVPFVADPDIVMREVARVLRPGGAWVFSLTHPFRWSMPDDGGPDGLRIVRSYFDRTPYVETGDDGRPRYSEHHRTIGDRVRDLVAAGFDVEDVVEPEWPSEHEREWGPWTPLRGRLVPGTAVFVTRRR
jgi:SAM-dependent methyltransferase